MFLRIFNFDNEARAGETFLRRVPKFSPNFEEIFSRDHAKFEERN